MYDFCPYFTNDGSVGLFNKDYNDIYHSATGALTEAYEKFILPVDFNLLLRKEHINVLDICYGIGYNSKSFLNYIYENFSQKKSIMQKDYDTIYTNNNSKNETYNEQIYSDNIFNKISIDAVDNDKKLFYLSPFIRTGVKFFRNKNINFDYPKIEKYFKKYNSQNFPKIDNLINFLILMKIGSNNKDFYSSTELNHILNDKSYNQFFEGKIKGLYQIFQKSDDTFYPGTYKRLNLHNIYYQYLSKHYKRTLKHTKLEDVNFNTHIQDARSFIISAKKCYNLIFLDAFTPSKCPCLWSLEFFNELYKHLEQDGMLLTYSTASSVRNAMLQAGFYIGNNYDTRSEKIIGTIAVKNTALIKYKLSEFDLGLLKTKSGIVYRDENLNGQNEAIIEGRNFKVKNSDLISASKYKNNYKML